MIANWEKTVHLRWVKQLQGWGAFPSIALEQKWERTEWAESHRIRVEEEWREIPFPE